MWQVRDHWRIPRADTSYYLKRAIRARTIDDIVDYNDESDSFEQIERLFAKPVYLQRPTSANRPDRRASANGAGPRSSKPIPAR
jgi:hypothetical protein